jgi:hypothetical protein
VVQWWVYGLVHLQRWPANLWWSKSLLHTTCFLCFKASIGIPTYSSTPLFILKFLYGYNNKSSSFLIQNIILIIAIKKSKGIITKSKLSTFASKWNDDSYTKHGFLITSLGSPPYLPLHHLPCITQLTKQANGQYIPWISLW